MMNNSRNDSTYLTPRGAHRLGVAVGAARNWRAAEDRKARVTACGVSFANQLQATAPILDSTTPSNCRQPLITGRPVAASATAAYVKGFGVRRETGKE